MKKKRSPLLLTLVLPLVGLALALGLDQLETGKRLENLIVDARFKWRAKNDSSADSRILLVGISEQGLENIGRWPWPRAVHGQLLQLLTLRPPKVVAFDLLFTEESQDPDQDTGFADGLLLHPGAITGASADDLGGEGSEAALIGLTEPIPLKNIEGNVSALRGEDTALIPVEVVRESSKTGFVNVEPSRSDGLCRKAPLIVRVGNFVYPSLVLQCLMSGEGIEPDAVKVVLGDRIELEGEEGEWIIPIDEIGRMWINYRGTDTEGGNDVFEGTGAIVYYGLLYFLNEYGTRLAKDSSAEWLSHYETTDGEKVALPGVEDQYLIVGQAAAGLTDFGPTPLGPQTPLFKVHAMVLNNILQKDFLKGVSPIPLIIGFLIVTYLAIIFLRETRISLTLILPILLIGAFVAASFYLFSSSNLMIPTFWPVFGFVIAQGGLITYRLVSESQAKGRIKAMFSTYVAPEVVDQLIESGEEPKLGGEETEITAFFSDIQSFSGFSEILTPTQLVSLMNEYLSEMSHILKYYGTGTVDKFIGDAIVGIFGAPYHYPDHAYLGCKSAIKMQEKQAELREFWEKSGNWPDIVHQMRTRIGLNSGPAVVGNMGARDRMNYTMMGDTVNLAARTESGAKAYGVYTMVTGETKRSAEEAKDDMAFRFLDKIVVKGRTQPVEMFELVDFKHGLSPEMTNCLSIYEKGMEKYLSQDWDGAREQFEQSSRLELFQPDQPGIDTNPSLVLIQRCEAMKTNPPGEGWDGVFVMKSK